MGHPRDEVTVARRIALGLITLEVVLLGLSGAWLVFFYRPSSSAAWGPFAIRSAATASDRVRLLHRLVAYSAGPTSLAAATLVVIGAWRSRPRGRRRWLSVAVGPALPLLIAAAGFTGYLLPWDLLALRAVTIGRNMHGFPPAFGSDVRFVLLGGVEISKATLRRWFVVHVIILGLLLTATLVIAWRPRRRHHSTPTRGPDATEC